MPYEAWSWKHRSLASGKSSMARASMERAPGPARRRPPRIRHGLPTASSRRPPMTYGFNSDAESSPTPARARTPKPVRSPPLSCISHPLEHYTVTQFLYATCDPEHLGQSPESSRSVREALFVQQKEDQSESRANWIGYLAVGTDEGAAARARQARHRRGVAWRGAVRIYTGVSQRRKLRVVHVRHARAVRTAISPTKTQRCTAGFCLCTRRRTHQLG
jgi:hypothetical protein